MITKLQRITAGTALAGAILISLVAPGCETASSAGGEPLTSSAADVKRITGLPITIQVTPRMELDPSLPVICKSVVDAFRSTAKDPETSKRLGGLVHVVVIQDWASVGDKYHVELYDQVLTIQTPTDPADVDTLRPMITGVLKKAVHVAANRGR